MSRQAQTGGHSNSGVPRLFWAYRPLVGARGQLGGASHPRVAVHSGGLTEEGRLLVVLHCHEGALEALVPGARDHGRGPSWRKATPHTQLQH
jgi:hypothetical protein